MVTGSNGEKSKRRARGSFRVAYEIFSVTKSCLLLSFTGRIAARRADGAGVKNRVLLLSVGIRRIVRSSELHATGWLSSRAYLSRFPYSRTICAPDKTARA